MIALICDLLGLCGHPHTTFPQTLDRKQGPTVSCLTCGKRFDYSITEDWHRGEVVQRKPVDRVSSK